MSRLLLYECVLFHSHFHPGSGDYVLEMLILFVNSLIALNLRNASKECTDARWFTMQNLEQLVCTGSSTGKLPVAI